MFFRFLRFWPKFPSTSNDKKKLIFVIATLIIFTFTYTYINYNSKIIIVTIHIYNNKKTLNKLQYIRAKYNMFLITLHYH